MVESHLLSCVERQQAVCLSCNTEDPWEIPRASLKYIRKIEQGHFGDVWKGSCRWNNARSVAIKICEGSRHARDFLSEAHIMKYLGNPNVIELYGACTKIEPVYIVTELVTHGNLLDYLKDKRRRLEFKRLMYIASQIASGMAYLASINCIHRDLGAINVLMGIRDRAKIANFALAKLIEEDEDEYVTVEGDHFPIRWTAPESIDSGIYTIKSDVWSFGILLTEIVNRGVLPYAGMSVDEVVYKVQHGYRMPASPNCHPDLYDIMKQCWETEATERPTFERLNNKLELFFLLDDFYN